MRIAFLGFGLISGSVARALRASPESAGWPLVAWSPSGAGPASAVADGVIDRAAPDVPAAIEGADLVILGGPATACVELLDDLAGPWSGSLAPDAVITDVASTKAALSDAGGCPGSAVRRRSPDGRPRHARLRGVARRPCSWTGRG